MKPLDGCVNAVASLLFACCFFGLIILLLWEPVAVYGLGLRNLSFWQCVGLYFLCSILFRAGVTTKNGGKS